MITPEHVMNAVKSYYSDGSLPPIALTGYKDLTLSDLAKKQTETIENAAQTCGNPADCGKSTCSTGNCSPSTAKTGKEGHQRIKTSASIVIPKGVPFKINPRAKINVADGKKPGARPGNATTFNDDSVVDHPAVGGKVTVFVLCYGDFFDLHKKCLTSLLATIPMKRLDLRVGSNALGAQSLAMIEEYVQQGFITKHYRHTENAYKYPVMREMFYDESHPITTKWVLWFDDDSMCDVEPNWFNILATHIAQHHKGRDAHMIGANFVWTANPRQWDVLASRPWYKNRPRRDSRGNPSPNGSKILFVAGGFWAITLEALRAADIPDLGTGLTHTGGDWQIGEQLYQAGYGMRQFNGQKQFVRTSSVARRGATMPTIDQVKNHKPPSTPPTTQTPPTAPPRLRRIVEL
jgi:hypothetical protein